MMKLYQAFAADLNHLLNGARAVRIIVPEYMPLSVEEIGVSQEGHRLMLFCYYGEQHGECVRDPDLVFLFHDLPSGVAAEPVIRLGPSGRRPSIERGKAKDSKD